MHTATKPNILVICSDQHAARVTGAYGDPIVNTPHLDALAAEGCRFDTCYSNNPICVASRMSFMTGRYSFKCDVLDNNYILDSRYPTLAHIAARGGYHTALIGKMHFLGPDQHHGFLERPPGGEAGSPSVYGGVFYPPVDLNSNVLGNCSRPEPLFSVGAGQNAYEQYDTQYALETTREWLRNYARVAESGRAVSESAATSDKGACVAESPAPAVPPFFLTVGFLLPHCPYIAPAELFDKYAGRVKAPRLSRETLDALHPHHRAYREFVKLDDVPEENFDKAAAAYYALTERLDQNIGALMDTLRETGLLDNTIVVYFSDHGDMLGQAGRWHKESFRENALRVPLIIRHPSETLPRVVTTPVSLVDLMPTLCEFADVPPPPNLDGRSLIPLLREPDSATPRAIHAEIYSYWDHGDWRLSANRMVRLGDWKLCYYGAFDSYELFNMAVDPGETKNLADDPNFADILAELAPLIFTDGWSKHTAQELDARLDAIGCRDNINAFRDAVRRDPLPVDTPEYWTGMRTAVTSPE